MVWEQEVKCIVLLCKTEENDEVSFIVTGQEMGGGQVIKLPMDNCAFGSPVLQLTISNDQPA
jgi:hypothetical protein